MLVGCACWVRPAGVMRHQRNTLARGKPGPPIANHLTCNAVRNTRLGGVEMPCPGGPGRLSPTAEWTDDRRGGRTDGQAPLPQGPERTHRSTCRRGRAAWSAERPSISECWRRSGSCRGPSSGAACPTGTRFRAGTAPLGATRPCGVDAGLAAGPWASTAPPPCAGRCDTRFRDAVHVLRDAVHVPKWA